MTATHSAHSAKVERFRFEKAQVVYLCAGLLFIALAAAFLLLYLYCTPITNAVSRVAPRSTPEVIEQRAPEGSSQLVVDLDTDGFLSSDFTLKDLQTPSNSFASGAFGSTGSVTILDGVARFEVDAGSGVYNNEPVVRNLILSATDNHGNILWQDTHKISYYNYSGIFAVVVSGIIALIGLILLIVLSKSVRKSKKKRVSNEA